MFSRGLPAQSDRCQWFAGDNYNLQPWRKPRGCTMLELILASSGGGGGAGGAGGGTPGGGGAGSSGSLARYLFALKDLPNQLWVLSRRGGTGGLDVGTGTGGNGNGGSRTIVLVEPIISSALYLAISSDSAPAIGNGGGGTPSAGGSAGTAGVVALDTSAPLSQCALMTVYVAGTSAYNGSTGARSNNDPASFDLIAGNPLLPGAGGSGVGFAGAGYDGFSTFSSTLNWIADIPGGAVSMPGGDGFFASGIGFGGCGGGGGGTIGGAGGRGWFGCGGGGGGAGTVNGGKGGDGGDGLAIFNCW